MAFIGSAPDCGICLEVPSEEERRICGTCNGAFCFHCIEQWIETSAVPSCPLCRSDLEDTFSCTDDDCGSENMETNEAEVTAPLDSGALAGVAPSAELRSRFDISVLLNWLHSRRRFLVQRSATVFSARCDGLLEDAIRSTDLLVETCEDVLRPGSEMSVEGFAERVPQLEESFCQLFLKVEMAMCHEDTAREFGWMRR